MKTEKENDGSLKKHPYLLYVGLVVLLFLFLILMGGLALQNDWLPSRS
jgi:hypothetical protein